MVKSIFSASIRWSKVLQNCLFKTGNVSVYFSNMPFTSFNVDYFIYTYMCRMVMSYNIIDLISVSIMWVDSAIKIFIIRIPIQYDAIWTDLTLAAEVQFKNWEINTSKKCTKITVHSSPWYKFNKYYRD